MLRGLCCSRGTIRDILCAGRRLQGLAIHVVDVLFDTVDACELLLHTIRHIDNGLCHALRRLRRLLRAGCQLLRSRCDLIRRLLDILQELAQVIGHRIKGLREITQLVAGRDITVINTQVALRKFFRMLLQHPQRARNTLRKDLTDCHDEQNPQDRHNGKGDLHRRHLRINNAFRYGQNHDPFRSRHRSVADHRGLAIDFIAEHTASLLFHGIKMRLQARHHR